MEKANINFTNTESVTEMKANCTFQEAIWICNVRCVEKIKSIRERFPGNWVFSYNEHKGWSAYKQLMVWWDENDIILQSGELWKSAVTSVLFYYKNRKRSTLSIVTFLNEAVLLEGKTSGIYHKKYQLQKNKIPYAEQFLKAPTIEKFHSDWCDESITTVQILE